MTRWLLAAVPLAVSLWGAWARFSGSLPERDFRVLFLICAACWFLLALWAQGGNKGKNTA